MTRNVDQHIEAAIPAEVVENMMEFFPEYQDLNYEELLQHQESVYQSLKGNDRGSGMRLNDGQSDNQNQEEGESSRQASVDLQLALDEAFARSLQDVEDGFDDFSISQPTNTSADSAGHRNIGSEGSPATAEDQDDTQDDIDPDDMTYEQLHSLGESVGSESRGLSEELMSRLPTFTYSTGIFKKQKKCVICYATYKVGDQLIRLFCTHLYHSHCIKTWLMQNKTCPICLKEVSEN